MSWRDAADISEIAFFLGGGDLNFKAADVLLVGWLVCFPAVAHQDAELMQSGLIDTHWPLGTSVPTASERRDITGGDWATAEFMLQKW